MGESSLDPEHRLACGHTTGELVEHLAGDASPEFSAHAAECPHCRAALAELAPTWAPVREAAELSVEPPQGLLDRALLTARRARAGDTGPPVEIPQENGVLRVAPRTTLVVARRLSAELLARIPDARLLACTGDAHEVRVDVEVEYGASVPDLADRFQAELGAALREVLGAAVPAVWVRIADVAPRQEP